MQYLVAAYWMWFAVALLAGGAVGYWLRRRLGPQGGGRQVLRWGVAVVLISSVVAVLYWLPPRADLYPETLLLLSFCCAIGGLLGASLCSLTSGADNTRAARVGSAPPEAVALAERTREAVRSTQDEAAAFPGSIEDARLAVDAKAAELTRIVASARAAEDARLAVAAKAAEEARIAASARATEQARLAVDAKAAEVTRIAAAARAAGEVRVAAAAKATEEPRVAGVAKETEEARLAAAAKAAEAARVAAAARAAEEARLAAAAKAAEEARIAAAAQAAEQARLAAEAKAAEEARIAAAAKAAEEARPAVEAKAAKKARTAAAAKADAEAHLVAKARITAAAREAAAMMANASGVAAVAPVAEAGVSHPGSKPAGIAAPAEGADDLKLIKGIGPRNEKACHALGIYRLAQIAEWTPQEAVWVGHHIAFPGRIEREHWIAQARLLAAGGETEHAKAVKSGSLVVDDSADEPLDHASAELLAESLPAQTAAVEGEDKHPGRRPYGLADAMGQPDNLKKIRGIGPQNERRLQALGIWHFSQIAAWSEDNVKWVGSYLAFAGRIDREKWVAQARDLVAGKDPESPRRVAAGKVATPKDDGAGG